MLNDLVELLLCRFLPGVSRALGIGYHVEARITYHDLESLGSGKNTLLSPEDRRVNYQVYNSSSNSIYIADSSLKATDEHYTSQISGNSEYEQPGNDVHCYKGEVTFAPAVSGGGHLVVTEYILVENN